MAAVDPRLLRASPAARRFAIATVPLGVVSAAATIVQALALGHVVSGVLLHDEGLAAAAPGLALLAAASLVRGGVAWALEAGGHLASAAAARELRAWLVGTMLDARTGAEATDRATLAVAATSGVDALDPYFARYLPSLALALVVPLAILAAVAALDVESALLMAATLPLIPVFGYLVGRTTAQRARARYAALARLSGHFLAVVSGLPTLRAFNRGRVQVERIAETGETFRRETMATLRIAFLYAARRRGDLRRLGRALRRAALLTAAPPYPARLVGTVPLSESVSVGAYRRLAHEAIDDVLAAGRVPLVVGGTGLYLRAAVANLELPPAVGDGRRAHWESGYDRGGARRCARSARGARSGCAGGCRSTAGASFVRSSSPRPVRRLPRWSDRLWTRRLVCRRPSSHSTFHSRSSTAGSRRAPARWSSAVSSRRRAPRGRRRSRTAAHVLGLEEFATLAVEEAADGSPWPRAPRALPAQVAAPHAGRRYPRRRPACRGDRR